MTDQTYYIRVPVVQPGSKKASWQYIAVDPDLLRKAGIVAQLYIRTHVTEVRRQSRTKYDPVAVGPQNKNVACDVSGLLETLQSVIEQWETSLTSIGPEGQKLWDEEVCALPFKDFLKALGRGDVDGAQEHFTTLTYALLGITAGLVNRLKQEATTASGMTVAVEALDATLRKSGDITTNLLLDWGGEADAIVRTIRRMREIEAAAHDLGDRASTLRETLGRDLNDDDSVISAARRVLDGDATTVGFLLFAHQTQSGDAEGSEVEARLTEAREHIERCRRKERAANTRWVILQKEQAEILRLQSELGERIGQLSVSSRFFLEYEKRFGKGTARPCDLGNGEIISREEYAEAETLVRDGLWAPGTCRARIQSLLVAVFDALGAPPTFSDETRRILEDAERAIQRLERAFSEPAPLPIQSASQQPRLAHGNTLVATNTPTEAASGAVDPQRVEELYDLVIVVGYVLTSRPSPLAQSSIRAMLGTVACMGRCTEEEATLYVEPLTERSKQNGERIRPSDGQNVVQVWRTARSRWVQYKIRNQWCLKLALQQHRQAQRLMKQFGITEDMVRVAQRQRRDARQEEWKRRKQHIS